MQALSRQKKPFSEKKRQFSRQNRFLAAQYDGMACKEQVTERGTEHLHPVPRIYQIVVMSTISISLMPLFIARQSATAFAVSMQDSKQI